MSRKTLSLAYSERSLCRPGGIGGFGGLRWEQQHSHHGHRQPGMSLSAPLTFASGVGVASAAPVGNRHQLRNGRFDLLRHHRE